MLFLHFPWSLDYPNSLDFLCRVWKLILLCAVFDKYAFLQLNYAIELQRLWNEIFLLVGKTFYISSNYKMILHTLMRSVCVPPSWLQVASCNHPSMNSLQLSQASEQCDEVLHSNCTEIKFQNGLCSVTPHTRFSSLPPLSPLAYNIPAGHLAGHCKSAHSWIINSTCDGCTIRL